ncbi:transcription factor grauzone-like [Stomoxys calcitrans]|uniref:transcription factor grauzone-like n=1 Tax=Stomoxys calcitrans TaxID=35570 RepID=UPI0027E38DB3|nr:transcription factor grauzone-like [Stomoxys calcitrans]
MEWEQRLQYICEKCWQHIWEFHQFQQSVIEAQQGLHLHTVAAKEVVEVKIKPEVEINQQEVKLDLPSVEAFSTSTEDLIKSTAFNFDIKTEEPLDLNSDNDVMSSHGLEQLTDEEMSRMNTALANAVESYEEYSSNDDFTPNSSESTVAATRKSAGEFDELVALCRSSLECEICHHLVASYSQLEEHFSKNHASEDCYFMCCQLRLGNRYDLEKHIRYHRAPQQLRCEACCKAYRLEKHLRNHKRKVHTSKGGDKNAKDSKKLEDKYRCDQCLKNFGTKLLLTTHNHDVHKTMSNLYEKSLRHPNALHVHLANHTRGEKTHVCSFCSAAFNCRANYCQHMRKYHLQEWKKKLRNELAQRETLRGYRRETRADGMVFVCIYCSVEYAKQQSIYSHLKRCQRYDGPIELKKGFRLETRGESKVHVCIYCFKEYEKRQSIQNHMRHCLGYDRPLEPKRRYRLETRGKSRVYVCIYCSKEYEKLHSMHNHLYQRHREDKSLAEQASTISESPVPAEQQQPIHSRRFSQDSLNTRIIGPKTVGVSNITSDGDTLNELGKEGEIEEEDSLVTSREGNELKDENATVTFVKTEQISADAYALGNKELDESEMPPEFGDATWKTEEFIKSEEEFIKL